MRKLVPTTFVLAVGAAALMIYLRVPATDGAGGESVPTVRVARGDLVVSTVALGTVKPMVGAEVKVGSRLSGVVEKLHVGIGDVVRKGDVLAELEDADWRVRVAGLEAEVAESAARLEYARARLRAAEAVADTPELDRASARMDVAVLEAGIERVRARLAEARLQLGYTRIAAPVDGTIASVSTYEGETVAASFAAPTFVSIVDLGRLEVHAYVDESDVGRVEVGQPATFSVDAHPGRELEGVVTAIRPKAEIVNNVVNYVAIITAGDAGDVTLRPEMTARVGFVLDRRENALSVPRSALVTGGGASFVLEATASGWRKAPVRTGLFTTQRIEITDGLEEGAVVIANASAVPAE